MLAEFLPSGVLDLNFIQDLLDHWGNGFQVFGISDLGGSSPLLNKFLPKEHELRLQEKGKKR